jgi:hypothetical protein
MQAEVVGQLTAASLLDTVDQTPETRFTTEPPTAMQSAVGQLIALSSWVGAAPFRSAEGAG